MAREEIVEGLREAVRSKILNGWYPWNQSDGTQMWTIQPMIGLCQDYDDDGISDYLSMLRG